MLDAKRGNPMGLRASVRTKLRPTIGSFDDDGHKMGPDHPENTSKPRICLPKPAKSGAKPAKSGAKPAKSGAKPAQNGVLTDRNHPCWPYRPVRSRRDARGMDDHSPGRQWWTRPSGGHHRDRIFRQGSRLPDAPTKIAMGYRPAWAGIACPRALKPRRRSSRGRHGGERRGRP